MSMTSSDDALLQNLTEKEVAAVRRIILDAHGCPERQLLAWRVISKVVLKPSHPFNVHKQLHAANFEGWDSKHLGPKPAWIPSQESIADTNLATFMAAFEGSSAWEARRSGDPTQDLKLLQEISWREPEVFWPPVLTQLRIRFYRRPSRIYQPAENPDDGRWLPGALMNIADSALGGRDEDAPAVLWADEADPMRVRTLSRGELRRQSQSVAAALRRRGLKPGDVVAICAPMSARAVAIYLGATLAGCPVAGVAESFAPREVAARLRISRARLLVTQDVMLRGGKRHALFERAVAEVSEPALVLPGSGDGRVQAALRKGDISWQDFIAPSTLLEDFKAHEAAPHETTNILFSSGTTGEPKAIPWTHVTPLRAGIDTFAQQDVRPGHVLAFPTSLGWMMGPSLVYSSLLNGAAMAIFEGAPLGREYCKFIAAARVTMVGVVPSIVKAWRKADCMKGLDWGAVRSFMSTGEASSPDDCLWLMAQAGYKPVMELCGGTEIGGAFASGSFLQPQAPSTFSCPTMGARIVLLESGADGIAGGREITGPGIGELALLPPFLGASQRLLNADHYRVYYKGMPTAEGGGGILRRHGDIFERLPGGYFCAHGRSDDTMNLGGVKVSSVELERACVAALPSVAEAAAVAVPEPGGGPDRLVVFLVQAGGGPALNPEAAKSACQAALRADVNPLFKVDQVVVVDSLPRTATNKVMRRELRKQLVAKARM